MCYKYFIMFTVSTQISNALPENKQYIKSCKYQNNIFGQNEYDVSTLKIRENVQIGDKCRLLDLSN